MSKVSEEQAEEALFSARNRAREERIERAKDPHLRVEELNCRIESLEAEVALYKRAYAEEIIEARGARERASKAEAENATLRSWAAEASRADEDGCCTRCGCEFEDSRELTHECPPGFATKAPEHAADCDVTLHRNSRSNAIGRCTCTAAPPPRHGDLGPKCESCGKPKTWCSQCRVWTQTCCVEYGTCQCN